MRAIEQWLWKTGWGCKIDVSEPHATGEGQGQPQQELVPAEDGSDSEEGSNSDDSRELDERGNDEDNEDEDFEDEETVEGEFGYSIF